MSENLPWRPAHAQPRDKTGGTASRKCASPTAFSQWLNGLNGLIPPSGEGGDPIRFGSGTCAGSEPAAAEEHECLCAGSSARAGGSWRDTGSGDERRQDSSTGPV